MFDNDVMIVKCNYNEVISNPGNHLISIYFNIMQVIEIPKNEYIFHIDKNYTRIQKIQKDFYFITIHKVFNRSNGR